MITWVKKVIKDIKTIRELKKNEAELAEIKNSLEHRLSAAQNKAKKNIIKAIQEIDEALN
jgi:hypothetical protein